MKEKEKLLEILNSENEKPVSERNFDLIEETVDELMKLSPEGELTKKEINNEISKLTGSARKKHCKPVKFKRLLIAAVISALIIALSYSGVASRSPSVSAMQKSRDMLIEMEIGETIVVDGITITKRSPCKAYKTVDEFLSENDYNILYPAKLPGASSISKICIYDSDDNSGDEIKYKEIIFLTNGTISICASDNPRDRNYDNFLNDYLIKESICGYECSYFNTDNIYQCALKHNGWIYSIKALTYEELVSVIEGLVENK